MLTRFAILALAGLALAACQSPYGSPTVVTLVGSGLDRVEVFTPPVDTYYRQDGSYCEDYQLRQYRPNGQVRYGRATACRFQNQQWVLVSRDMEPWPVASAPPPPPPTVAVPNTGTPVPNPGTPAPPPPGPVSGGPGQWVPITQ